MKTLILALAITATLAGTGAAALMPAEGTAAAAACGNTSYQGVRARTYCGPAAAAVKLAGRSLTYRGGSCTRTSQAIELGIGTLILDSKEPKSLPRSFGISIGRIFGIGKPAAKDGTYDSATVALVEAGKRYAGTGKATLTNSRSRGSFTVKLFGGETLTGTFRCA